jgi:signal peptide peptidase SppA
MFQLQSDLWLGDEASLRHILALEARASMNAAILQPQTAAAAGEKLPRLYSRYGEIGVITIRGGLINTEDRFTEYFNISTYPAIREALAFAASDQRVSQVLLDIESPGGVVSGVNDVAGLVREVRATKPVTAFSDGLIASAAYWIGSAADKIYVGQTAIVGSIGVIATLVSIHDALQKDGVNVKVVRAGKNKALGHPAEPMNDKAVKQVQDRANAIYDVFTATVMQNRSKLKASDEDTWAQGNEFLGADAVDAKLADQVSTFDRVVAQLVDNQKSLHNTSGTKIRGSDSMKPRAVLSEQLVALIATGVELTEAQKAEVAAANAAEAEATAQAATEAAAAKAVKDAADAKAVKDAADAAAAAAAAASATPAKVDPPVEKNELVAYLEGQLATAKAALATAQAEAKTATDAATEMRGPHDALVTIAVDSINKMTIALGGSAMDFKGVPAKEIVAKHATTLATFGKKYPVGGVASTAPEDKNKKPAEPAAVTSIDAARVRMSRINPQGGK